MPEVFKEVAPQQTLPFNVYGRELERGPGRMAEDVYGVSTPNILNQMYQRYRGRHLYGTPWQAPSLRQIPTRAVQEIGPMFSGSMGLPNVLEGESTVPDLRDYMETVEHMRDMLRAGHPQPTIQEAIGMQYAIDADLEKFVKSEVAAGRALDPRIKRAWDAMNERWVRQDAELLEKVRREKQAGTFKYSGPPIGSGRVGQQ